MKIDKLINTIFLVTLSCFSSQSLYAEALLSPVCKAYELIEAPAIPEDFNKGILFKVEKPGQAASHIFGTMHVDDAEIVNLPDPVNTVFENSDRYVMEAIFSQEELLAITQVMFFQDGTTLSSMTDPVIFKRLIEILIPYGMDENAANLLKPWAAFLTISYPPPKGLPLDYMLAERAKAAGKHVHGLESMSEQMAIFANISNSDQMKMLNDTVCHFDKLQTMIVDMKALYLNQDIGGLYSMSYRHSPEDKKLFDELMDRILTKRNINMVRRMQPLLQEGNAFIAVGALHLPAKEGVLYLLQEQGYTVTRVH